MTPLRVLVVDDSVTIRAMLEQMIDSEPGCQVVRTAASADEADLLMQSCRADVMTLDRTMPGIDGLHFLRRLKDRCHPPDRHPVLERQEQGGGNAGGARGGRIRRFRQGGVTREFPGFFAHIEKERACISAGSRADPR